MLVNRIIHSGSTAALLAWKIQVISIFHHNVDSMVDVLWLCLLSKQK